MFTADDPTQAWLERFLTAHGGIAGTVHVARDGDLHLRAAHHIPPPVNAAVLHVPRGKGMAGIAQVSGRPVQTCNLKEDDSGRVKPGARAVDAQAAIALPVLDASGAVRAVVGIAFAREGEIGSDHERALMDAASSVPG
jgi:L-methionine (R)-S-oxide reductase